MYELFRKTYTGNSKQFPVSRLNSLRPTLIRDLVKITSYYKKQETSVKDSHLIVKLIDFLNVSHKRDSESIVNACIDRTPQACKVLKLIHAYNPNSETHSGVFYNQRVTEIIVADESSIIDHELIKKDWYNLNTIKIVTHPFDDIDMCLCDGKYPHAKSGYAVMYINVPALILQYKYWCENRLRNGNHILEPKFFVSQIVIPNMLFNHTKIAFVNRAMTMYDGRMVPDFRRRHNVSLGNHTETIDAAIKEQLNAYDQGVTDINNFYTLFPAMLGGYWKDHFQVPYIAPTLNVRWTMDMAVAKYVDFLVRYYNKKAHEKLRPISGQIKANIRILQTTKEIARMVNLGGVDYIGSIKTHLGEHVI